MKIVRRAPRVEYLSVRNTLVRDYRLSWRARGLLVELLSYPAGWETSVDELVKQGRREGDATEGRDAMRAAARELERLGYLIRTKCQDKRTGQWATVLEVTDEPAPMTGRELREALRGEADEPPADADTFAQVTPTTENPSSGVEDAFAQVEPTTGNPAVGSPVVGESGVSKKTETKTVRKPPPPRTETHQRTDASVPAAADGDDAVKAGRELLAKLPGRWRPDADLIARTLPDVAARLRNGWSPTQIREELTRNGEGLNNPRAALPRRAAVLPAEPPCRRPATRPEPRPVAASESTRERLTATARQGVRAAKQRPYRPAAGPESALGSSGVVVPAARPETASGAL